MFARPVDHLYPVKTVYGEEGVRFENHMDPHLFRWMAGRGADGMGHHCGIDFDCPRGTLVRAIADGFIVRASYDEIKGAGLRILQLVMVPGFDSWMVQYSHLQSRVVHPGQKVWRFDPIAESGETGKVAAPYLHVDLMDLRGQYRPLTFDN